MFLFSGFSTPVEGRGVIAFTLKKDSGQRKLSRKETLFVPSQLALPEKEAHALPSPPKEGPEGGTLFSSVEPKVTSRNARGSGFGV